MDKLQTKQELLAKLTALTSVPDDNNIYLKEKVSLTKISRTLVCISQFRPRRY